MSIKTNMASSRTETCTAVHLEFHDRKARVVCIAGTFNGWSPKRTAMVSAGAGRWTKELWLPPGLYEYQYVVDGRWVNDPQAVRSTPNPYGGRNSVLVAEKNNSV